MRTARIVTAVAFAALFAAIDFHWVDDGPQISLLGAPVQARIGHPLTPLSYAGVARRTTRRAVRRTAYWLDVLPGSCIYGVYFGAHYYRCGNVYYERSGSRYVQVIVN